MLSDGRPHNVPVAERSNRTFDHSSCMPTFEVVLLFSCVGWGVIRPINLCLLNATITAPTLQPRWQDGRTLLTLALHRLLDDEVFDEGRTEAFGVEVHVS